MSEQEEFEFRARAEQEAAASKKPEAKEAPSPKAEVPSDKPKFLPSSAGEAMSEGAKVVGQGVVGLSADMLDIGNKPISELLAGEVGKNVELGALLQKNINSRIAAFAKSGMINPDVMRADAETLNTKIGFPVPPQPETGLGKILGLSARVAGNIIAFKAGEGINTRLTSPKFKLPSSEKLEAAIKAVDSNVQTAQEINKVKLDTVKSRTKFEEEMIHKVRDSEELSFLENQKADVAYSRAQEIHGKPGEAGLAVKASKKLNEAYWEEAKPYFNAELYVDDVKEGIKTTLQKHGVIDANGDRVKDIQLSDPHAKALKFYESLTTKDPEGIVDVLGDMKKIKVGEYKAKLEATLGRKGGSDMLTQEIFQESGQYIKGLKDVNTKFVADYQTRNAVYDKFNIFNKIGWRKGAVSIEPGAKMLENLSEVDPAKINRDFLQMDDFLTRYTGESVSAPVKKISGEMLSIRDSAIKRNFMNQASIDSLEARIMSQEARSKVNAESIKANLSDVAKLSKAREQRLSWMKKATGITAATTAATMVGSKVVDVISKLAK